jgi:hypothetical protein
VGVCDGTVAGGAVGFVVGVPGGAVGFCWVGVVGVVVPGIGSFPGGRVGSPGGGVGLGVDCGVCASAALVTANKTLDRITALTKVRDMKVNINEQLLKSDPSGSQVQR